MTKIFFIATLFLISCSSSHERIEKLEKENIDLKTELNIVKTKLKEIKLTPIIFPEKDTIRLGENYQAVVGMVIGSKNMRPTVILGEKFENGLVVNGDTIRNGNGHFRHYVDSGADIGLHKIAGQVTFKLLDSIYLGYVMTEFNVKK